MQTCERKVKNYVNHSKQVALCHLAFPPFFIPQYNTNINEPKVERAGSAVDRTVQHQNKLINGTTVKGETNNKINLLLSIVLHQT